MTKNDASHIALNELIRMRKKLIAEIGDDETVLARRRTVLFHIGQTIKAISPTTKLEELSAGAVAYSRHKRGEKARFLAHGEITRSLYDTFRVSPDLTVCSRDVAMGLMAEKGFDPEANPVIYRDFELRVRNQLFALRRQKIVEKVGDDQGGTARWRQLRRIDRS